MNLSSYINLCKPKIVALLTVTALIGMLLSVNFYTNLTNVFNGLASLVGFALLAAASAALNQIFDRETDKNMSRTKSRPLAAGNISLTEALTFTAILLFVGSSLMLYFSNLLTLMITTFGFIFYSLIYTIYLKWATPQNIVIGGLSGALPPLIGWTAVSNEISLMPLILVLIIFLWTPPHFWPLAIDRMEEYKKEGVPMMPIAKGVTRTKKEMVVYAYTTISFFVLVTPFAIGIIGTPSFLYSSILSIASGQKCGGVHKKIIKTRISGIREISLLTAVQPISGGSAPDKPPMTIF